MTLTDSINGAIVNCIEEELVTNPEIKNKSVRRSLFENIDDDEEIIDQQDPQ